MGPVNSIFSADTRMFRMLMGVYVEKENVNVCINATLCVQMATQSVLRFALFLKSEQRIVCSIKLT